MSLVVATNPFTSTRESLPKRIPFGLISINFPLDVSVPNILELTPLVTRLTLIELDEGI